METLKEKGYEVLYLFDRIDEFTLDRMESYKEKNLNLLQEESLTFLKTCRTKKRSWRKTTENSSMIDKIKELFCRKGNFC